MHSAVELASKIRNQEITSLEVTQAFIGRIKEVNTIINCVVDDCFEEALQAAKDADELIASEKYTLDELEKEKPFLGVPISVKDQISSKGLINCGGF
uniref:Amidase domain-containing protein n=1 Tax=Megaselia scalaris TaxID=36166 RepID=T1H0W9_MEGSC